MDLRQRIPLLCGLTACLALLSACGSYREVDVASLAPAPLPAYGIGDAYEFTDGSTETVVATDRDEVRWRGEDGNYVTTRSVLLPRTKWSSPSAHGDRRYFTAPDLLFPLQSGKSVMFSASRTVRPAAGGPPVTTKEDWRCGVAGAAPVDTPAGHFDTWRVDCAMSERAGSPGVGLVQRSFFYAPTIGFYVRREERIGDAPPQVIELSNYATAQPALPDTALSLRVAGLQQALERNQSGQPATWTDPASGDTGDVQPIRTMQSDKYGWCRDFAEAIHASGRTYHLEGTGCRDRSGIWNIIALSPNNGGSG